jgi:hypothetical protein
MTDLVYQTTLGGNLTLRATNTAANPIITIPAVTSTLITSADTATVTANMIVPGALSQTATYLQGSAGSVSRTIQNKLQESVSVKDFGAIGDDTTDDTVAIQAAVNACSIGGSVYFPAGKYKITSAITINKPIMIFGVGPGSFINNLGSYIRQATTSANAFTLVATLANYSFSQYGIVDVHFKDIAIVGNSSSSFSARGIGVDTTVNSGDFHIRECTFTNVNVRYFTTGYELVGIAYLNRWYAGCVNQCGTGVGIYRGTASDLGGQTRFFGTTFDLMTDACVRLNTDTLGGDFSFFGCTLSESSYGIIANEEVILTVTGCSFESLVKSGSLGAGIYITMTDSNPTTSGTKTITGNKFLTSDVDIWVNKTSTANAGGTFYFPMLLDGNYFGSTEALRLNVPSGGFGFASPAFVFGQSNSGPTGPVTASQINANFYGTDLRKRRITKQYTFGASYVSGNTLDLLPQNFVVLSARMYLTVNSSSFTGLALGNADNNSAFIAAINASTQALNTWVNYTPTVPQYIIDSANKSKLILTATAGMFGAQGVVEIDGYTI